MTEFAKIIVASGGEQVLFYTYNGDGEPDLVIVTQIGCAGVKVRLTYDDDEARNEAFAGADLATANGIRRDLT